MHQKHTVADAIFTELFDVIVSEVALNTKDFTPLEQKYNEV